MRGTLTGADFAWRIFDTKTGRPATVAAFASKESAEAQIAAWQRRQAKGGRPDVDASGLVAVHVDGEAVAR